MDSRLALHGGRPAIDGPPPHFRWPPAVPGLGAAIARYVDGQGPLSIADRSGVYAALEDRLGQLFGRKYALLTSSGTTALYSAFFAVGVERGDEVISTAYSFHATASPLLHLGAEIVFCDVETDTGNIDASLLAGLVGGRTRAVVTNHQWGHPVDCESVRSACARHAVPWVEDCSHAHFAEYRGKRVGSFGDVSVFSLQGNKFLTGGEGGVLLTDSREIYERATLLGHWLARSEQCVLDPRWEAIRRTGYGLKFRMHPLAAVTVMHLLDHHVDEWVRSRKLVLDRFAEALTPSGLVLPMARRDYVTSMGGQYGFKPRMAPGVGASRAALVRALQSENVEVAIPGSEPLPRLPLFDPDRFPINRFKKGGTSGRAFPGADSYWASILSLPTFTFEADLLLVEAYGRAFEKVAHHAESLR